MSFLFGGSGGSSQSGGSSSTTNVNYAPWYESYVQNILGKAQELGKTPFPAYDISKMYAPFQPAQQQAFGQVQNNQNSFQPYINSATGALSNVAGLNPAAAAQPFLTAAGNTPNPLQSGAGYLTQSAQGWNPTTQAQYTNPFLSGALNYGSQLASNTFFENTLPRINDQFIKSGGALGRGQNNEMIARATRDFGNSMIGNYMTGAANNYWQGANQFNQDQSRLATAGAGLGALSGQTMSGYGNLANTASNITSGAVNTGTGLANAYSNLGGALSNLNLTNTNALLQVGNQQQQQAQNPLSAAYQQFQQGVQWPFQLVNFMRGASQGLQIPSTSTMNSQNWQNSSQGSSPSILGGILGAASTVMGIPGVSGALGGALTGAGNLFSGFNWNGTPGSSMMSGLNNQANWQLQNGNGIVWKRGGAVGPLSSARRGEPVRRAVGGSIPVMKGALSNPGPSMRALMGTQGRPPQMGGALGPAMAPPIAAGALRGINKR